MTHSYNISGMTCKGCVAKAKNQLLMVGDITEVNLQLTAPQATITMLKHIPTSVLQNALSKAGNYTITEADDEIHHVQATEAKSWLAAYKPVLLIGAYITGFTLLVEAVRGDFSAENWMHNFMAAFFLVFSFFKFLDLKGFAENYSAYDIVAKKWFAWGYIYVFIELLLGIAYIIRFNLLITHAVTFLVMSVSIIGVLETVINKRTIKCACLGSVFNLPMSTVTIIEDGLMIAMSGIMFMSIVLH